MVNTHNRLPTGGFPSEIHILNILKSYYRWNGWNHSFLLNIASIGTIVVMGL